MVQSLFIGIGHPQNSQNHCADSRHRNKSITHTLEKGDIKIFTAFDILRNKVVVEETPLKY